MRINHCFFCSSPCYPGKGITFVRNDSKTFNFCRSKCHKNFKLKRNPRKLRWTKAFRKATGKEMTLDSTLDFENKRNIPTRYDRQLIKSTLYAMKRIQQINTRRQSAFYKTRIAIANPNRRVKSNNSKSENQTLLMNRNVHLHNSIAPHPQLHHTSRSDSKPKLVSALVYNTSAKRITMNFSHHHHTH